MNHPEQYLPEERLVAAAKARRLSFAVAESCTGGMLAQRITSVPGASAMFAGGVISYSNDVKRDLLGVGQDVLDREGAVSLACAEAMATGVRARLGADLAVSVTGIAGPDGGTPDKPVGLVCFGLASPSGARSEKRFFEGDRESIRRQAADHAFALALSELGDNASPVPHA
ncbi:MAG: CinA family protein [Kiritimatiellae bacterium]|nr:CinA family protein [Kiritimatiellia bacterium]